MFDLILYVTEINSDVDDGCTSAGYSSTPPQTRASAFIWNRPHLKETDSLTTVLVTEDTFKSLKPLMSGG